MRKRTNKRYEQDPVYSTEELLKGIAAFLVYAAAFAFAFFCEPIATMILGG